jgi:membrane-bound lytic murein transglycosylase MltF
MRVVHIRLVTALTVASVAPIQFAARRNLAESRAESRQQSAPATLQKPVPESTASLELPINFERHVGDLDGMEKRHQIRVLVVPSHSGFFYDKGHPQGIYFEAFDEFQRFLSVKLKTGSLKTNVVYIPVRPEQLEHALLEGVGDVIGYGVIVTPERETQALFTIPIASNVKQVIVTGAKAPAVTNLEELSGKEIYVNPLTVYFETLQDLSAAFQKAGEPAISVKAADTNLTDEDLLEMVNADLIPATVTINVRAEFWSKVLPHLTLHPNIVLKDEGQLAFATRKDSPELNRLLDEFIDGHQLGSSFGNALLRRYLQNTKWVQDATSTEEMKKFHAYVEYFKKYAAEYDFDFLILVAQGYQESLLDQSRKNPSGAVGIMQVIPKYAAAPPISVSNVDVAENNIHAGAKMLHNIAETYFNDPHLDALNKTLFTFAAYNAGPNRIVRLRKKAAMDGLDPDRWFGNVELVAAKDIGQETVQYVSNIYKYYVAYKLTLESGEAVK